MTDVSYVIHLEGLAWSPPDYVDHAAGRFLSGYLIHPQPIGTVLSTDDPAKALLFDSFTQAIEFWKQEHGTRDDGRPNRPITAYTVTVLTLDQAKELASH